MFRLLKLEYSKFRKSTVIVLLATFFLLFFPFSLYVGSVFPELPAFLPSAEIFYVFPTVWDYLGYAGNWMVYFFFGVLVIYTITLEVRYKTLRQSVIIGLSRKEFFISKLLVILVLAIVATLYYSLIALIVGWINTPDPSISLAFENQWSIARFFLMSISYMTCAMMFAYLLRNAGLAIFLYLSYVLIIENLLRIGHLKMEDSGLTNFYPMNATEDLMPLPFFRFAEFITSNQYDFNILLSYKEAALATSGYVLIFIGISYYNFIKRDI